MRVHPAYQGFYDNALYKPTYLINYLLTYFNRHLVQPRCALYRLLSANSLFICSLNFFVFISVTR